MVQSGAKSEAAQAIAASVAQIELAVREAQPAVEQLGILVANISSQLAQLRKARPRRFDPDIVAVFPDEFDRTVARLEKHVHGGITQLQFYDRLVQHLAHVQDFLLGTARQLGEGANEVANDAAWEELRGKLRVRLISAAQRELLDAVLPPPEGAHFNSQQARDEHAAQGTIELF
jgi:hypothetical protein